MYAGGYQAPPYEPYKKQKFHKTKERVRLILKGIEQTSLRPEDKKKLLKEIKKMVAKY